MVSYEKTVSLRVLNREHPLLPNTNHLVDHVVTDAELLESNWNLFEIFKQTYSPPNNPYPWDKSIILSAKLGK